MKKALFGLIFYAKKVPNLLKIRNLFILRAFVSLRFNNYLIPNPDTSSVVEITIHSLAAEEVQSVFP